MQKLSSPNSEDWNKLKRLARYLVDKTRSRVLYGYQSKPDSLDVYTDTDFAGCARTRKSTSGGVIMYGSHLIKTWSSTQNVIALSSGEAEYYGLVKGASQGLGVKNMMNEYGVETKVTVKTDASAAKGIASRRGSGKVRHIEVSQLWVQSKVAQGALKNTKDCNNRESRRSLDQVLGSRGGGFTYV